MTKTDYENLLHKVTSNELNFPSQAELIELAVKTNEKENCNAAIKHIFKKLQEPKEKWRKIYKVLQLIETMIIKGNRRVTLELQSKVFLVQNLINFFYKENGVDVGQQSGFKSQGQGQIGVLSTLK